MNIMSKIKNKNCYIGLFDLKRSAVIISGYLDEKLNLPPGDREVVHYGITLIINGAAGILAVVILGTVFGVLSEALAVSIAAASLRIFSGGFHFSSPLRCALFGGFVAAFAGIAAVNLPDTLLGGYIYVFAVLEWLAGLGVIIRYAPADTPQRPIKEAGARKSFKRKSLIVLTVTVVLSIILLICRESGFSIYISFFFGLIWQLFTVTPLGYDLLGKADCVLAKFVP